MSEDGGKKRGMECARFHRRKFANYVVAGRLIVPNHDIRNIKPIKRPKDMPRANRPWTREEWETVIDAAPPHLRAPILLCCVLAWREGEAKEADEARNSAGKEMKQCARAQTPAAYGCMKSALFAQDWSQDSSSVNRIRG